MGNHKGKMVTSVPSIKDGCLMVRGKALLTEVQANITVTAASNESAFVGATSAAPSPRHVFSLGVLEGYRLMCLFRFKIWWTIPCFGTSGREVPAETQMLLLDVREKQNADDEFETTAENFYVLILPVLEGLFRSSLQGTSFNELQLCIESGDSSVRTSQAKEAVFINSGDDPFKLISSSIKILEKHKGTFNHIENKQLPEHIEWFGWSTWDAFYTNIDQEGIEEGLQSFSQGGRPPRCLFIDDGWQNTVNAIHEKGENYWSRIVNFEENEKFKQSSSGNSSTDLREFIKTIKERYGVKYVYMWHGAVGYWGGVLPSSEVMRKYNPNIAYIVQSPGNLSNVICPTIHLMNVSGIGIIDPLKIFNFYNDYHSYLASCGVDGVKVDIINVLETLGSGYRGRVSMVRQYLEALEKSVKKNFGGNNLICSMSLSTDFLYSARKAAAARASEDFMPNEPTFQTLHIATAAFNGLLLGEIVVPDWDMFYSDHYTAEFHGSARALAGSAVYVSDKPGSHNFDVIKKLVLPDGSILRARYAARPTRDCLFSDPVMDGQSLLKIWNLNKLSGVIGVFNCQRAGCWPPVHGSAYEPSKEGFPLSGYVSPIDVEALEELAGSRDWSGCAVYSFNSGSLSTMPKAAKFPVVLERLKCEIFTICPIRVYNQNIQFAPIGLLNMYNAGGAIEALNYEKNPSTECKIKVIVRGCGYFGAYSNIKPKSCAVDKEGGKFTYSAEDGLVAVELLGGCNSKEIVFVY